MADAGDEAEHFEVFRKDGIFDIINRGVEDFAGYFWADAAYRNELAKEVEFIMIGESVKVEGVFADVAVDEKGGLRIERECLGDAGGKVHEIAYIASV